MKPLPVKQRPTCGKCLTPNSSNETRERVEGLAYGGVRAEGSATTHVKRWLGPDGCMTASDITLDIDLAYKNMREGPAVFVFGSNLAGRHGKGAALTALTEYGAVRGQGVGLQGRSYAIPTKDERLQVLPLERIAEYVQQFLVFAAMTPEVNYVVTRIGCGLAGYTDTQMAPLFARAPDNCGLPMYWRELAL